MIVYTNTNICMHIQKYKHICTYKYTNMYTHTNTYKNIHMNTYIYTRRDLLLSYMLLLSYIACTLVCAHSQCALCQTLSLSLSLSLSITFCSFSYSSLSLACAYTHTTSLFSSPLSFSLSLHSRVSLPPHKRARARFLSPMGGETHTSNRETNKT
jgi:hypothetical protein